MKTEIPPKSSKIVIWPLLDLNKSLIDKERIMIKNVRD